MGDPPASRRRVLADRLPPPYLRAFPSHSMYNHNIRKGLRPQAQVNGRNGGDPLTPCVANAPQINPHTQICCFIRCAIKSTGNSARLWRNGRPGLCKKHHFLLIKAHAPQKFSRLRRAVAAFGGKCFWHRPLRVDRAGAERTARSWSNPMVHPKDQAASCTCHHPAALWAWRSAGSLCSWLWCRDADTCCCACRSLRSVGFTANHS